MHLVHKGTEAEVGGLPAHKESMENSSTGWQVPSKTPSVFRILEFHQIYPDQMH